MHFNLIFIWVSKGLCKLFAQTMDDRENAMAEQTPTTDGIAHIKLQQFIKRLRNKFAQTVVVRKVK